MVYADHLFPVTCTNLIRSGRKCMYQVPSNMDGHPRGTLEESLFCHRSVKHPPHRKSNWPRPSRPFIRPWRDSCAAKLGDWSVFWINCIKIFVLYFYLWLVFLLLLFLLSQLPGFYLFCIFHCFLLFFLLLLITQSHLTWAAIYEQIGV